MYIYDILLFGVSGLIEQAIERNIVYLWYFTVYVLLLIFIGRWGIDPEEELDLEETNQVSLRNESYYWAAIL